MQLPVLELHPVENTFLQKRISLIPGEHVRLGRVIECRADRIASEGNGYFPSKTLSRQHAEVWEDNGKIFVKDTGSSNGTFLNGERLSLEAVQSEPFELTSGDVMVLGIDVTGEDGTIVHHKMTARVQCLFPE